jgi:hypothetical protein
MTTSSNTNDKDARDRATVDQGDGDGVTGVDGMSLLRRAIADGEDPAEVRRQRQRAGGRVPGQAAEER